MDGVDLFDDLTGSLGILEVCGAIVLLVAIDKIAAITKLACLIGLFKFPFFCLVFFLLEFFLDKSEIKEGIRMLGELQGIAIKSGSRGCLSQCHEAVADVVIPLMHEGGCLDLHIL